jgi:DNA-binding LacI/PurR family transcriptional regulator
LISDILGGAFEQREPSLSYKELQARYGCGYHLLRRILKELATEGWIRFEKRAVCSGLSHPAGYRPVIAFLAHTPDIGGIEARFGRNRELLSAMESSSLAMHFKPEAIGLSPYNRHYLSQLRPRVRGIRNLQGIIVDLWWNQVPGVQERVAESLAWLAGRGAPVAILDEISQFQVSTVGAKRDNVAVIRPSGRSAGKAMAQHLLGLGHRHIGYFTRQPDSLWSQLRYEGAAEATREAGKGARISLYRWEKEIELFTLALAACPLPLPQFKRVFRYAFSEYEYHDWLENRRIARRSRLPREIPLSAAKRAEAVMATLASLDKPDLGWRYTFNVIMDAITAAAGILTEAYYTPLFEEALRDRSITAWMCAADSSALNARSLLRRKGISCPGPISLCGFDNSDESMDHNITSFDFRMDRMVHHALSFVRTGRLGGADRKSRIVEVEGSVIERGSTGRAP